MHVCGGSRGLLSKKKDLTEMVQRQPGSRTLRSAFVLQAISIRSLVVAEREQHCNNQ